MKRASIRHASSRPLWEFVKATRNGYGSFCCVPARKEETTIAGENRFGTLHVLDIIVKTSFGSAVVRSGWIVQFSEGFRGSQPATLRKQSDSMNRIALLSPVALLEDVPTQRLTKGQLGTVEFLHRDGEAALLVEFSDETGQTYVMADLNADQLLALYRNTEAA